MKRITAILLLACIIITAAACGREARTLYESPGLKIDRCGNETTIQDKHTGSLYTLQAALTRRPKGTPAQIKDIADTPTISIQAGGGLVIVTDKTNGQAVYIHRNHG